MAGKHLFLFHMVSRPHPECHSPLYNSSAPAVRRDVPESDANRSAFVRRTQLRSISPPERYNAPLHYVETAFFPLRTVQIRWTSGLSSCSGLRRFRGSVTQAEFPWTKPCRPALHKCRTFQPVLASVFSDLPESQHPSDATIPVSVLPVSFHQTEYGFPSVRGSIRKIPGHSLP